MYLHTDYGIAFDGKGSWSFNDDFTRNVIIFGVHYINHLILTILKMFFLISGEGDTFGINGSFGAPKKIILVK